MDAPAIAATPTHDKPRPKTLFVIRADVPFSGVPLSFITGNGTVAYTDGWTPAHYAEQRGFPIRIVDETELDVLVTAHTQTLVGDPREESADDYEEALNVLPPCRYSVHRGVEMFHISERITHDIVRWHARIDRRFFSFNDRDRASFDDLARKVADAAGVTSL